MSEFLSPVFAIVLVLGLLAGALWLLRRRGMTVPVAGAGRQMARVETMPLGGQHALHLVRMGERKILIATGPGCCQIRDIE